MDATLSGWQVKAWAVAGIYASLWIIIEIAIGLHGAALIVTGAIAAFAILFELALWALHG